MTPPSTETSPSSTGLLFEELTSSAEASPASKSPQQGKAKASGRKKRQQSDLACGGKCGGSSEKHDPLGCLLRTSLLSALEAATKSWLLWKPSATPAGRLWSVLGRSAPRTNEIAPGSSGDWVTPSVAIAEGGQTSRSGARKNEPLLRGQAIASEDQWRSPQARDGENRGLQSGSERLALDATVEELDGQPAPDSPSTTGKSRGSLNSAWVSSLMGFPHDWCVLPIEALSRLTATRLSRKSQKKSSE